jgi:CheY-like chemotaxis protein
VSEKAVVAPVLYAEDDKNDVLFMQVAFRKAGLPNSLQIVRNGKEAMDYLAGNGPYADRAAYPQPCLVLLDLNMPVSTGFEVLRWARQQPRFQRLPMVVLTASSKESDRKLARLLGANEYVTKPNNPGELPGLLQGLRDRWLAPMQAV